MKTLKQLAETWSKKDFTTAFKQIGDFGKIKVPTLIDTLSGAELMDSLHGYALAAGLNPFRVSGPGDCSAHAGQCGTCVMGNWVPCA